MLNDKDAMATIAVKDLKAAKRFYEETLGLRPDGMDDDGGVTYRSGNAHVLVYVSLYAGTNQATAATWNVGNALEETVKDLRAKGVTFEHYDDLPDTKREGDIHLAGPVRVAWLKDPDGNILALVSE
jgi:catechol 2,3-dioxygenase-like lactoylglutathione lyase family enzyme